MNIPHEPKTQKSSIGVSHLEGASACTGRPASISQPQRRRPLPRPSKLGCSPLKFWQLFSGELPYLKVNQAEFPNQPAPVPPPELLFKPQQSNCQQSNLRSDSTSQQLSKFSCRSFLPQLPKPSSTFVNILSHHHLSIPSSEYPNSSFSSTLSSSPVRIHSFSCSLIPQSSETHFSTTSTLPHASPAPRSLSSSLPLHNTETLYESTFSFSGTAPGQSCPANHCTDFWHAPRVLPLTVNTKHQSNFAANPQSPSNPSQNNNTLSPTNRQSSPSFLTINPRTQTSPHPSTTSALLTPASTPIAIPPPPHHLFLSPFFLLPSSSPPIPSTVSPRQPLLLLPLLSTNLDNPTSAPPRAPPPGYKPTNDRPSDRPRADEHRKRRTQGTVNRRHDEAEAECRRGQVT